MAQPYNDEAFWRFWRHIRPVFNRTSQGPPPVNVVNYFTIIANSPRPLTLTLVIYLEDLGERYPAEWAEAERQVRLQGGPNHELGAETLPQIETYIQLSFGCRTNVKENFRINLAREQYRHIKGIRKLQVQRRLDKVLGFSAPRHTTLSENPAAIRSLAVLHPYENPRKRNQNTLTQEHPRTRNRDHLL